MKTRFGEGEVLAQDVAHHLLGFDQGVSGTNVGALGPSLVCDLPVLHDLRNANVSLRRVRRRRQRPGTHPRGQDHAADEYRTGQVDALLHASSPFDALDVDQGRDEQRGEPLGWKDSADVPDEMFERVAFLLRDL